MTLQLSAYYYAIQVYNLLSPQLTSHRHDVYHAQPQAVIDAVLKSGVNEKSVKDLMAKLTRYNDLLSDFMQAQLLLSLGKGEFQNQLYFYSICKCV